jgi:uncharacterized protein
MTAAAPDDATARLEAIVRSTGWLMAVLRAARAVDPPDWLVGAGALRTAVWDRLHGHESPPALKDVDLVYFDAEDLSPELEERIATGLRDLLPGVPWDVKNQAAVHLWYPRAFGFEVEPLRSSADGVATWPETATAVAVRLTADDRLDICAPCGLNDLLGLVHRRNPRRVSVAEYERRLQSKRIAERWPRARIVPARATGA